MSGEILATAKGTYRARYRHRNVYYTPGHSFATKALARSWLAAERRLIELGTWTPPAERRAAEKAEALRESLTVKGFCEAEIERRARRSVRPLKRTTVDRYRKDLAYCLPLLGHLTLATITRAHVQAWYDSMPVEAPTQRANSYATLKTLLNGAVDLELLAENPCRVRGAGKPEPVREGYALDSTRLLAYLAALDDTHRLLLTLTALTGLRSGEARGLRRCDLDLKSGVVSVRQAVSRIQIAPGKRDWLIDTPKTKAGVRDVALPPDWLPVLREWAKALPVRDREHLLFTARDGVSPLADSVMWEAHQRAVTNANKALLATHAEASAKPGKPRPAPELLPADLQLHDLRRTALTLAAEGGATVAELMRMAGHTTAGVAMRYQKASADRDRARAERLGKLLPAL